MFERARAFLFDFDGTLIQQRIDFDLMRRQALEVVARYGLPTEPLRKMYVLEMIDLVQAQLAAQEPARGRAFYAEVQQVITALELEAAEGAKAFPGVPEFLRTLRERGLAVGIVTRNCRAAVERVLQHNHLPYDVLLTRDDVAQVKPDPRHLAAALEILGIPAPQSVMCGDHPMDVLAGQRIGAMTVGVLPAGKPADYFAEVRPDLVVASVTEILDHW
jgi:phosphoglycolate phosphatase